MHRGVWGVIFSLGIYILVKGLMITAANGKLEQTAARACLPAVTYAEQDKPENWFTMLVKETVPLYAYWKEKETYLPEPETGDELIVRERSFERKPEAETADSAADNMAQTEMAEVTDTEKEQTEEADDETGKEKQKEQENEEKKEEDGKKTDKNRKERQKVSEADRDALRDFNYLIGNYYTVDMSTTADSAQINADALLSPDMTMQGDASAPQILIYHTHSQEAFADSVPGDTNTTIVGMGDYLTELLTQKYGYNVIHNTSVFDMVDGQLDRNTAYTLAAEEISRVLEENPSIEVVIDLHRDGLDGEKMVTDIDGKQTARIMFFNGLSRTARNGNIDYLPNPYISENLAFSFQLQLKAEEYYPGFTRPVYLQSLRYNLHMKPKSLLVEAGSQLNTVEEERNAMEPLADILDMVLKGE